jgi:tetratricopeptide (TPR) repeat protein
MSTTTHTQDEIIRANDLFLKASQLIKDNIKVGEAVFILESILHDLPNFGKAYNHLGWIYKNKYQNNEKAVEYFEKCIELQPDFPPVYYNYASLLSQTGNFDRLEQILTQAISVHGIDKCIIFNEFGILHELRENYAEAEIFYIQSMKLALDNKLVDNRLSAVERCRKKAAFMRASKGN